MANRDLNPHKPARMAMWLWSADYAARGLGSMGYWDQLREGEKETCRRAVKEILESPDEFIPRLIPRTRGGTKGDRG